MERMESMEAGASAKIRQWPVRAASQRRPRVQNTWLRPSDVNGGMLSKLFLMIIRLVSRFQ